MDSLDLTSLLTNLQLQTSLTDPAIAQHSTFTLFPTLPTELRLKILSHAIPNSAILDLLVEVIVADANFGLYCTFVPAVKAEAGLGSIFTSASATKSEPLKATRETNLLLVNKEFYEFYVKEFPLSLPTGKRGKGKIRFAPYETVYINNFETLLQDGDFVQAITQGYRLQNFWTAIQNLAVPITTLILHQPTNPPWLVHPSLVIRRFVHLKEVRALMWDGFVEQVNEEKSRRQIRKGMEWHLGELRMCLVNLLTHENTAMETGETEVKEEYEVPRMVLV